MFIFYRFLFRDKWVLRPLINSFRNSQLVATILNNIINTECCVQRLKRMILEIFCHMYFMFMNVNIYFWLKIWLLPRYKTSKKNVTQKVWNFHVFVKGVCCNQTSQTHTQMYIATNIAVSAASNRHMTKCCIYAWFCDLLHFYIKLDGVILL